MPDLFGHPNRQRDGLTPVRVTLAVVLTTRDLKARDPQLHRP